jgi:hypothetical protein
MPNNGSTATVNAAGTGDAQIRTAMGGLVLTGYCIRETAGAAAQVTIRNGTSTSDPAVAHVNFTANQEKTLMFGEGGIKCPNGIFLDRTSGTTEAVIYSYP